MPRKKPFYIQGLPISAKWKLSIMSILFVILLLNQILPIFFEVLDYPNRLIVSLIILILFVAFSIGNKLTESIVIGLAIFSIMSNLWDFSVYDISDFRKQILLGSLGVLSISLVLGEISVINLVSIIRNQLGVSKKH